MEEKLPVFIAKEDLLPIVPSGGDVIQSPGIFQSQRSSHACIILLFNSMHNAWPDPIFLGVRYRHALAGWKNPVARLRSRQGVCSRSKTRELVPAAVDIVVVEMQLRKPDPINASRIYRYRVPAVRQTVE